MSIPPIGWVIVITLAVFLWALIVAAIVALSGVFA